MKILDTTKSSFKEEFQELLKRGEVDIDRVMPIVSEILTRIKRDKDKALLEDIAKFDNWKPNSIEDLKVSQEEMKKAYEDLDEKLKEALHIAYDRIKSYHEKLLPKSWIEEDEINAKLGVKVTPVDRAGLYIPGGKAAYPSSLLMNAIPAIVANVKEIVVTTPAPNNELNPLLLAAAHLCNIKEIYKIGGASAIGALAYGTNSIKKVDVITGPGNIYVATAKKMVYGDVNIDMIAGPSEIGVIANSSANPRWIAIDLLSQAEHDEMASSILITPDRDFAYEVEKNIYIELEKLNRKEITKKSIENRAAIIITKNLDEAIDLMNEIAPEHLEIVIEDPFSILDKIKNAGAIFLGSYTPEAIGDYIAGPNHTLPTGGSAKFYSPLSVEHFLKKSSIISFSKESIEKIGEAAALLADIEGLDAHAKSVRVRLDENNS
ncbi:MAG: histidinol dehydrogenase [Epsilonproteobacteria bacterium]|nr:histidinol dehydrogenase [Campylobacterota bacterium]